MNVLVTGANGFIGKNLVTHLRRNDDLKVLTFEKDNNEDELKQLLIQSDFIFHLAGINRPEKVDEFYSGNSGLTEKIISILKDNNLKVPILLSSSIQAANDNDYGKSKLESEEHLVGFTELLEVPLYIFRLPNVFGKWCRPNYNSVIATWCYNIANDLEIKVSDRSIELSLVYIDDVVNSFIDIMKGETVRYKTPEKNYYSVDKTYNKNLGEILDLLESFKAKRENLYVDNVGDGFERILYATYLSYFKNGQFSYGIPGHSDERGSFFEILKTLKSGQFSVSTSKPGITRGNHYHHTKNEKFLVIKGKAIIRFRHILEDTIFEYIVRGDKPEIFDIPPGYTHNISNVGNDEMILIIWANEVFDQNNPDTYYEEV